MISFVDRQDLSLISPQGERFLWPAVNGSAPPKRVLAADDTMTADTAYQSICSGNTLFWQGDFHNAKQLLHAIARRFERKAARQSDDPRQTFQLYRLRQAQGAHILGQLLIGLSADHRIALRRAPNVQDACQAAIGSMSAPYCLSLRELQGIIGAYEWRKKGVFIEALGVHIHPHYGVFSPLRSEYLRLIEQTPLPSALADNSIAFDIGTGCGVIAALLAKRQIARIIATDNQERALGCARDTVQRLGLEQRIEVCAADVFPSTPQKAALIVCNPPWLPGKPSSTLETAVYDPDSRMLRTFLQHVPAHLLPQGEAWLILSDLAERLHLRSRQDLLTLVDAAGLRVKARHDIRPQHPRSQDPKDPLYHARSTEVTSLWQLVLKESS